jgi:uncharacterized protein (DUF952 family)
LSDETEETDETGSIHHLAPASELLAATSDEIYAPARLPEDGFVHCSGSPAQTLLVADDYFAGLREPLIVLVIEPSLLGAPLRYEAPAPLAGGGRAHLDGAVAFPHVYGPIERRAIRAAGVLERRRDRFTWPARLEPLAAVLARLRDHSSETPKRS